MFKEMKVAGLVMDTKTNSPILVLKDIISNASLPIWIGLLEATAIATELEKVQFPRPMTHDLMRNCFQTLGVDVERVEVCDLRDNTYYAHIYLRHSGGVSRVDARPSDAVAIALRTEAPIFVSDTVLNKLLHTDGESAQIFDKSNQDEWFEMLDKLDPKEFSKYKM